MIDFTRDEIGHGCFARDEHGEVHAFHASIRDQLIARGDLRCVDGYWYLHSASPAQHVQDVTPWLAMCDFCGARPVTWTIPCESFEIPDPPSLRALASERGADIPPHYSTGAWAACEPCGVFIGDWNKASLLARALKAHGGLREIRDAQKQLHRAFWKYYRGGAVRIPARPFGH